MACSTKFAVVKFVDDDDDDGAYEIVPYNWLHSFKSSDISMCYWMPDKADKGKIINCVTPGDSWPSFKVRIIYRTDDYATAFCKLPTALLTSDLATEVEDDKRPRLEPNRRILMYESSDEDVPQLPKKSKTAAVGKPSKKFGSNIGTTSPMQPSFSWVFPLTSSDKSESHTKLGSAKQFSTSTPRSPMTSSIRPSRSSQKPSTSSGSSRTRTPKLCSTEIDRGQQILLSIEDLKSEVRSLTKLVLAMYRSLSKKPAEEEAPQPLSEDISLPLATMSQVGALEERLVNDLSLRNALIAHLSEYGNDSMAAAVRRMMRTLMTNELAANFNMRGQRGKVGFMKLHLFQIICAAVRRQPSTEKIADGSIFKVVQNWLKYAKARITVPVALGGEEQPLLSEKPQLDPQDRNREASASEEPTAKSIVDLSGPSPTESNIELQPRLGAAVLQGPLPFSHEPQIMQTIQGGRRVYKYACPICKKTLTKMREHLRNIHNENDVNITYLMRHLKKLKNGEKRVRCPQPQCGAFVLRLDKHLRARHKIFRIPKVKKNTIVSQNKKLSDKVDLTAFTPTENPSDGIESNDLEEHTFSKELEILILEFGQFMCSLDGEKTVAQKLSQIRLLLSEVDPKSIDDLFNHQSFHRFVKSNVDCYVWKAETARFYLQSLKEFFEFLLYQKTEMLNDDQKRALASCLVKIPKWKKSLVDISKMQKELSREDQLQLLHDAGDTAQIFSSASFAKAKEMVEFLGRTTGDCPIQPSMYVSILSFIITMITIRLPKRSGVLGDILLKDYLQKNASNGEYCVRVVSRKTSKQYGSSVVAFSASQATWIDIYVSKMRPRVASLPGSHHEYLFLKKNGTKFSNDDMRHYLQQAFSSAGLEKTSNNILRKSLITASGSADESSEEVLSVTLDHSQATGKLHYRLFNKVSSTIKAAKFSDNIMFGNGGLEKVLALNTGEVIAEDHEAPSVAEPDSPDTIENAVSSQENISINDEDCSNLTQLETQSLALLKPQDSSEKQEAGSHSSKKSCSSVMPSRRPTSGAVMEDDAPFVAEPDSHPQGAVENAVSSPQENISINHDYSSISTQLETQSLALMKPKDSSQMQEAGPHSSKKSCSSVLPSHHPTNTPSAGTFRGRRGKPSTFTSTELNQLERTVYNNRHSIFSVTFLRDIEDMSPIISKYGEAKVLNKIRNLRAAMKNQ